MQPTSSSLLLIDFSFTHPLLALSFTRLPSPYLSPFLVRYCSVLRLAPLSFSLSFSLLFFVLLPFSFSLARARSLSLSLLLFLPISCLLSLSLSLYLLLVSLSSPRRYYLGWTPGYQPGGGSRTRNFSDTERDTGGDSLYRDAKMYGRERGWKRRRWSATIHDGKEESDFCTLYLPRCVLPPHVARRDVALRSRRERRRGALQLLSTTTLRKPRSLPPHPPFRFVSPPARTCGASTTNLPLLVAPHGGVVPPPPVT